jgi:sec-independent protein translocase protein TatB
MFGIGMSEMLLIAVVALVVIGPKHLPDVVRTVGKLFAQVKRTTNDLRDHVDKEVRQFTEMEEVQEFKHSVESELRTVNSTVRDYVQHEVSQAEREFDAKESAAVPPAQTPDETATADAHSAPPAAAGMDPSALPEAGKLPS